MREIITISCTVCKRRNYTSMKNKKTTPDRLELSKYCRWCKKHTPHKEEKQGLASLIVFWASSSIGQSSGLQNQWLGVRVPPRLRAFGDACFFMSYKDIKEKTVNYLKEINSESKKVVWPGKNYVVAATIIVLVIVLLVALFVMFVDFSFSKMFGYISKARMR